VFSGASVSIFHINSLDSEMLYVNCRKSGRIDEVDKIYGSGNSPLKLVASSSATLLFKFIIMLVSFIKSIISNSVCVCVRD